MTVNINKIRKQLNRLSTQFNTVERQETKTYSRDVFVLVDESHRSNYGLMATKMRSVFPNACYIGFTGTVAAVHRIPARQSSSEMDSLGLS